MHKDDASSKDTGVKHSRNTATGKAGHNRKFRRMTRLRLRRGEDLKHNSTSYNT